MIYYICHHKHAYTLGIFLAYYRNDFRDRIRIISYDDLFRIKQLDAGILIFTDFDRLGSTQLNAVRALSTYLQDHAPHMLIFNDPRRALGRFDLLQALHRSDPTAPAVARLSEWQSITQFPVFIRGERDHLSALSGLLETKSELEAAATSLLDNHADASDLIVIQFRNAPNDNGFYEKYGAFRIGDTIYGQHVFQNKSWWVKENDGWTEAQIASSRAYIADNPHAARLMPYFDTAGIEYGRIDYCINDGAIVVFEINTNPVVNTRPPTKSMTYDAQSYADLHNNALLALPHVTGGPVDLPPNDLADGKTVTAEHAHQRMLRKVRRKLLGRKIRSTLRRVRSVIRGGRFAR